MLTIHGWESTFEKADTRKVKGALTWVAMPCDLQSEGLCEILQHPEGAEVLGIWLLLVEYAASKPAGKRDGTIPASLKTLSFSIRVSVEQLENAISVLAAVGWVTSDSSSTETLRRSSEDLPKIVGGSSEEVRTTGQDRTGQEKTPLPPSGEAVKKTKPKPPEVDPDLISKVIQEWNAIRKRWSLDHWPVARTPRSLSSLAARITECGGPDPFLEAFKDRLERAAVGYRKPPESGWAPDLAWILKPNGWDKAGAYQRPKPVLEPVTHDMPEGIDFWNPEKSGLRR